MGFFCGTLNIGSASVILQGDLTVRNLDTLEMLYNMNAFPLVMRYDIVAKQ